MLPEYGDELTVDFDIVSHPTKTYGLNIEKNSISGYVDGIDAVKQAVFLILATERFAWAIYSWNYGIETRKLIGMQKPLVYSEIERTITEALLQDDRIESVSSFEFSKDKEKIKVSFVVKSVYGEFNAEREVGVG